MSTSRLDYEAIQQKTKCNWCRNLMVMSEPISQANFVDTGKKYPALYCSGCLSKPERVKQPKLCINPDTLDELVLEDLPDVSDNNKEQKATKEIVATEEEAADEL